MPNPVTDFAAWRASTLEKAADWYFALPERGLMELDKALQRLRAYQIPVTDVRVSEYLDPACVQHLALARAALETGRGFVIIRGVPSERYSTAEFQTIYWLIGQLLGRPVTQNVQGTLLYDVQDQGKDVRYGARFSVTNAETGFHTDNSFGEKIVDYVGLLCLSPAKSGGVNQVVSGYTVHHELRVRCPDVLQILSQPFHVDRRGGVRPGEEPTILAPVLHWHEDELHCRYLRYWIEVGHEKAGQPLTAEQKRALDILDETLRDPALRVEFALRPGEMFFINNRCIFHNRSAFEDHPEPERRRHYVRLWLERSNRCEAP